MKGFSAISKGAFFLCDHCMTTWVSLRHHSTTVKFLSPDVAPAATSPPQSDMARRPQGIRYDEDEGISKELGGFGHYANSITVFMKPDSEKIATRKGSAPLPCEAVDLQDAQAKLMTEAAMTGKLPVPRISRVKNATMPTPQRSSTGDVTVKVSSLPKHLGQKTDALAASHASTSSSGGELNMPSDGDPASVVSKTSEKLPVAHLEVAEDYYRFLPRNKMTKEAMWKRITEARAEQTDTKVDPNAKGSSVLDVDEVDYVRMVEVLQEHDSFHYSLGEFAYPDELVRRSYYALWYLAMSLNKSRWSMLEVQSQRGVKSTGAGMKLLFWKEAVNSIMDRRAMISGQFTDSHPVLRPFAAAVARTPGMTRTFVRSFTDARLKIIQQPGNMKQLFDHFDKFYGYFFNSLLEVTMLKDENAEHMMQHIGRAIGLTTHSVMFWKKYARMGFTMLPADLCADNHVNLALLRNIPLASRDGGVRKLIYDILCVAKTEMLHAQQLAPLVPPKAWPVVMECLYPNYYLGFLQRRDYDVSAMFADYNIENAGFVWYRLKKRWEWEKHQSLEQLLAEAAPLPWIGTSWAHRGSKYKMASGMGNDRKK